MLRNFFFYASAARVRPKLYFPGTGRLAQDVPERFQQEPADTMVDAVAEEGPTLPFLSASLRLDRWCVWMRACRS